MMNQMVAVLAVKRCMAGLAVIAERVEHLEAVADAARAYEQATRNEAGVRERAKLFGAMSRTLDVLGKEA